MSINWTYETAFTLKRMDRWERDLRLILRLLWMMPLLSAKEMAGITGFAENRSYRLVSELMGRKLVVRASMGRGQGKKSRHWLTARGVLQVADETGEAVPWQVTEAGVGWVARRLPIVEALYALVPELMRHEGVKLDAYVPLTTEPDGTGTVAAFTPELKLSEFCWMQKGEIDAVVSYENGAWFPLIWVGTMVPERRLIEKSELAVRQLDVGEQPAGWVLVGFDLLAAWLAARIWPADNVLAMSTDGHVEREMRPGPFTEPLRELTKRGKRLGRPENLTNWWNIQSRQYKPALAALDSPMHYRVLRFIAEWNGPTPDQLMRRFGTSYRAAVRPLMQAGLVKKLDGEFYLSEGGGLTLAHMDRVSPASVARRIEGYLDEGGAYRKNQRQHTRFLIDAVLKLMNDDVTAFGGWRTRRTAPDGIQVVPDATMLAKDEQGSWSVVFVELELIAETPKAIQRKVDTYRAVLRQMGGGFSQMWILKNSRIVERYCKALGDMDGIAIALDELLKDGP